MILITLDLLYSGPASDLDDRYIARIEVSKERRLQLLL